MRGVDLLPQFCNLHNQIVKEHVGVPPSGGPPLNTERFPPRPRAELRPLFPYYTKWHFHLSV